MIFAPLLWNEAREELREWDNLAKKMPLIAKLSFAVFKSALFYSGLMVTAASAYFHRNKLRGVAGVDIPMTDLLSDVQYFNQAGPKSYAFLFHAKTGSTLSHPKLPTPEAITDDPNSVNILELEQGKEFKKLLEEVQRTGRLRYVKWLMSEECNCPDCQY